MNFRQKSNTPRQAEDIFYCGKYESFPSCLSWLLLTVIGHREKLLTCQMLFGGTDFYSNHNYSVASCLFRGWIKNTDIATIHQLIQCGWDWNIWTTVMIVLQKIAADLSSKNNNDVWYVIQETNETFFNMSEVLFAGKGHKHRIPPATGYALEEFHWQRADDAGKCLAMRTFRSWNTRTMPWALPEQNRANFLLYPVY